jgi:hypothetical protein
MILVESVGRPFSSPLPLAGEVAALAECGGWGPDFANRMAFRCSPSPTLPRKRERELTSAANTARPTSSCSSLDNGRGPKSETQPSFSRETFIAVSENSAVFSLSLDWAQCWRPRRVFTVTASASALSNAAEDDDSRCGRQRVPRYPQAPLGPLVDFELLADPAHEIFERSGETMHRQHH